MNMSKPQMRHPEEEQILRYADGELPSRAARKIRNHLNACWECRAQLQEIEETISNCVGYRRSVLQSHLPTPPAPWADIYQRFSEMDASTEPVFFPAAEPSAASPKRGLSWLFTGPGRWAFAAAALVIVSVGIVYRFRQTPSALAAELLRKAVAAADATPRQQLKTRRIRIRTVQHDITRSVGPVAETASNAAQSDALSSVQAMFLAARYDWQDPLSAQAFQSWRNQLPNKRDEVVETQDHYRIHTTTDSGELVSASLDLHSGDYEPLEERFEFRDSSWVEITAIESAPESSTIAVVPSRSPEPRTGLPPATAPSSAARVPEAVATISDELHAFAVLHKAGADLGDPIEVTLNGGKVLITGVGIAPQRQREISDMLATQPQFVVRFTDAAPSSVKPERESVPQESNTNSTVRDLQSRLAQSVGGRANFEELAGQVLDLTDNMMSRAYALRRLAERFPASAETDLSAADLQLLRTLREEHISALRQQVAQIERAVKPALGAAPAGNAHLAGDWHSAAGQVMQSSRRLEKLLAVVFGAAAVDTSAPRTEPLPTQVLYTLAELRARAEAFERLNTQPPERSNR